MQTDSEFERLYADCLRSIQRESGCRPTGEPCQKICPCADLNAQEMRSSIIEWLREEAPSRLAGERSFVRDIPKERLRALIEGTESELVGHWPQETH